MLSLQEEGAIGRSSAQRSSPHHSDRLFRTHVSAHRGGGVHLDHGRLERSAWKMCCMGNWNFGGAPRPFDSGQCCGPGVDWGNSLRQMGTEVERRQSPRRTGPHQDGNPKGSGRRSASHKINDDAHHDRRSPWRAAVHCGRRRHPGTVAIEFSGETVINLRTNKHHLPRRVLQCTEVDEDIPRLLPLSLQEKQGALINVGNSRVSKQLPTCTARQEDTARSM